MKAARIVEFNKPIEIQTMPDPTPGPNDAVIQVDAAGICRSDWHSWKGDFSWLGLSPQLPIVPGHEFGGRVVDFGKNVKNFEKGEKVSAPFHYGCGHCHYCREGRSNLCEHLELYGAVHDGCYAEYMLVPDADFNLVSLPESIKPATAAAIGCRVMTGFHGIMRSDVKPGEFVAVQGAGGVGLSAIQTAHAVGAQVIAVDIADDKLEKAKEEGADFVINSKKENVPEAIKEITNGGAHAGIDALGIKETILNSVNSLRKGGRHVQIGLTGSEEQGEVKMPIDAVTASEIEVVGSLGNPHSSYGNLLALVSQGRIQPDRLIEREVSINDVNEVFNDMTNFKTNGLNIITRFA